MIDNTLLNKLVEKMRQEYLELTEEQQTESIASVAASRLSPARKAIILFAMTGEVSYLEEVVKGKTFLEEVSSGVSC